ncbi:MAG: S8 family serine peptidase [Nitrospirae bacterium]|nr:S8 family serine peptidase [Nitrospirota bacterium]
MTAGRKLRINPTPGVSQKTVFPTRPVMSTRRQFLRLSLSTVAALLLLKQTASGQPTIPAPCDLTPHSDIGLSPNAFPDTLERKPGVELRLDPTRLLLGLKSAQARERILNFFRDFQSDILPEGIHGHGNFNVAEATVGKRRVNHTATRMWITSTGKPALVSPGFATLLNRFGSDLEWIGPVYRVGDNTDDRGLVCPLPNVLLIRFAPSLSKEEEGELIKRLERMGLRENREKSEYLNLYRYFIMVNPLQPVYHIADHIKKCEQRYIRATRFENMPLISNLAYMPNDPEYAIRAFRNSNPDGQWNMVAIKAGSRKYWAPPVVASEHNPNSPIPPYTGWDISTGSSSVAVWLIDPDMCDLHHPDLAGQFLTQGIDLSTMGTPDYQNFAPATMQHATRVAGILAAGLNNQDATGRHYIGIAGLAGACRLVPLVIPDQTDVELALALNYAAENWERPDPGSSGTTATARVVCLSWGVEEEDENIIDREQVDLALCKCATEGLIICAASMNSGVEGVAYPARHPDVIACGASLKPDTAGIEKRRNGSPGGSNHGPELSVVAPGVEIRTTNSAYNGNGNRVLGRDLYVNFGQTSAATAHVAGLAALLLSVNPGLTNRQARKIIERTADKINDQSSGGTYTYLISTHPNGSWHNEVGYGRINVLRALEMASNPCVPTDMGFVEANVGGVRLSGPSPLNIEGVYGPITIAPAHASNGSARIELVYYADGIVELALVNALIQTKQRVDNFRITFCGQFEAAEEIVKFRITGGGNMSGRPGVRYPHFFIRVQGRVSDSSTFWEEIATTSSSFPHFSRNLGLNPLLPVFNLSETGFLRLKGRLHTLKADILVSMVFRNSTLELDECGIRKL